MENINLSAEQLIIRPAHNGFIVSGYTGPEDNYKVREEYVFTSLEELYNFLVDKFVLPEGYKAEYVNNKNRWSDAVYGGGS